jgi:AmiR/NasT family two-component response regulator
MSRPADASSLPDVLVAEPDVLLRRAVKQVAEEVGIARVHETPDIHGAVREMELRPFSALVIALDREGDAFDLLTLLRCGQYPSGASTPAAVLLRTSQEGAAVRLASLGVHETLDGPHSVRRVLDLIGRLV